MKEELLEALEIYNYFRIPEEKLRMILAYGFSFDFTYGDKDREKANRHYDFLSFANFLKICKELDIDLDIKNLLENSSDNKYKEIIPMVEAYSKYSRKLKQK